MSKPSLQSARKRLQMFPQLFASCGKEGTVYGRCIARKYDDIAPHACEKEFQLFRDCLHRAAKDMKTKI